MSSIKGFRNIVFIFIVITTTFRPICPPAVFRCLSNSETFTELRTTFSIESTRATCSDSVSHNRVQALIIPVLLHACSQDWTYKWLSPLKLREPTPITVMPCVLLDNSEWILGTYILNVLTWLELQLLCICVINVWNFNMYYGNCYFVFVLIWNRKGTELALHAIRLVYIGKMVSLPPSFSFLFLSFLSDCILFSCGVWWSPVRILLELWFISMLLTGW